MPRYSPDHVPKYRLHKQSGRAVVTIAGRDHMLGEYDPDPRSKSPSRKKYKKLIAEWFDAGCDRTTLEASRRPGAVDNGLNVEQVIAAFWDHAIKHYVDQHGQQTGEAEQFIYSLKVLRRRYGQTAAADFSAGSLKACRAEMIESGLARNTINRRIGRVRQVFRWAVSEELVPPAVIWSLGTVTGLQRHRSAARETGAVKPVAEAHARSAIRHGSRHVAAMIELHLLTGMRSGELVIMRTADIDRGGDVWLYRPTKHKTQHHGHDRVVYLGRRSQQLLQPFLKLDPTAYLFSPADATAERRQAAGDARKTPLSCGNRPGSNRRGNPQQQKGEVISVEES